MKLIRKNLIPADCYYRLLKEYASDENRGMSLRYLSGLIAVFNDQKLDDFFRFYGTGKQRKPLLIDPQVELPANGLIYTEENIEDVRARFPELTFTSPLDRYYDFTPAGVSKGSAVRFTRRLENIPREKSISFGDGENDLEMFKATGFSVAMGNGDEAVKSQADYVTDSIENDGLAKAINTLCLGG